ncbi:MAG: hypothetical protein HQK60_07900, partial [Deltaproteobacteria bacterium]|nr:hypothetical protein [Deltaproteobacteria bacterium]
MIGKPGSRFMIGHFHWRFGLKVFWLWLILGVASSVVWGQQPAPPEANILTLDQAISMSLRGNRTVENAALEVQKSEDLIAAVKTSRLPALSLMIQESWLLTPFDFEFKKGAFGEYPNIGPIPSKDTTISTPRQATTMAIAKVAQPLTQQYRIGL